MKLFKRKNRIPGAISSGLPTRFSGRSSERIRLDASGSYESVKTFSTNGVRTPPAVFASKGAKVAVVDVDSEAGTETVQYDQGGWRRSKPDLGGCFKSVGCAEMVE
jgi:hypothetical protein